ncbi:biotin/lipoyl-containing protein [Stappia sp.]|uniref:biotin/lipoyl-containing protein n=1 Tax=Stappia sp. TaxID=1870903 RepID=UPI0032D8E493
MPHDVIMPALGMAQDSGLIVAWLKQPGDAIKPGDALMEVETDKATMEVEAQAEGYLTNVRAQAGDSVPVGDVVARISETADADTDAAAEDTAPAPDAVDAPQAPLAPEGTPIIMPALGMAQDSAVILTWQKAPGDRVGADDILLEVETDKSAMEVPAGIEGYVAGLFAEAGATVPVGEVIALIADTMPETPLTAWPGGDAKPAPTAAPQAPTPEDAAQKAASAPAAPEATAAPPPTPGGKILASPKARRLARERGLDLAMLVRAKVPQPFHVADLTTLEALPASTPEASAATAGTGGATRRIEARVPAANLDALLAWLAEETGAPPRRTAVLAAFAAAALRAATDAAPAPAAITVETSSRAGTTLYADPDRAGLGACEPAGEDAPAPDVILRDLTGTPVTALSLGGEAAPVLTLTRDGEALTVTCECGAAQLSAQEALALTSGFAERLGDPLRHLL